MNNFNFNAFLAASKVQISVCSCAERISNNEESNRLSLRFFNHVITPAFHEFSIRKFHFLTKKSLQLLSINAQNGSIHLQIDFLRLLNEFKSSHRDILLRSQAQPYHIQNHLFNLIINYNKIHFFYFSEPSLFIIIPNTPPEFFSVGDIFFMPMGLSF